MDRFHFLSIFKRMFRRYDGEMKLLRAKTALKVTGIAPPLKREIRHRLTRKKDASTDGPRHLSDALAAAHDTIDGASPQVFAKLVPECSDLLLPAPTHIDCQHRQANSTATVDQFGIGSFPHRATTKTTPSRTSTLRWTVILQYNTEMKPALTANWTTRSRKTLQGHLQVEVHHELREGPNPNRTP